MKRDADGGVLLDLSHERDYVQWLAGPLEVEHAASGKVSNLEIDSDDPIASLGKTEGGARVYISLNYSTVSQEDRLLLMAKESASMGI